MRLRYRTVARVIVCGSLTACAVPGRMEIPEATMSTTEGAVSALADSILAAARARDADRFVNYFEPGESPVYVLNTSSRLSSQGALRDAFRGMLTRQREFDPRWADRRVQVLSPAAAVFTGAFRTTARDTSGKPWGARGVVTFVARRGADGWRVINWHTSESAVAP